MVSVGPLRWHAVLTFASTVVAAASVQGQAAERSWLSEPKLLASYVDQDGTHFGDAQEIVRLPIEGFAVVDRGENSILAFRADGNLAWKFGRSGGGPGEFGFIQDIDITPSGEIIVLDRSLNRVTMIDGTHGQLVTTYQIQGLGSYGILPSPGSRGALVVPESGKDVTLWRSVSEGGQVLDSANMVLPCGHNLACEFFTTTTGEWGSAIAFRWSSKFILLEPDGSVRSVLDGIERIPFPEVKSYTVQPPPETGWGPVRTTRVDPTADEVVVRVAANDKHLGVLFSGSTEYRRRIVDTYSLPSGQYSGSILFPDDVDGIALLSDGKLATLDLDFFPTVQLWEIAW